MNFSKGFLSYKRECEVFAFCASQYRTWPLNWGCCRGLAPRVSWCLQCFCYSQVSEKSCERIIFNLDMWILVLKLNHGYKNFHDLFQPNLLLSNYSWILLFSLVSTERIFCADSPLFSFLVQFADYWVNNLSVQTLYFLCGCQAVALNLGPWPSQNSCSSWSAPSPTDELWWASWPKTSAQI